MLKLFVWVEMLLAVTSKSRFKEHVAEPIGFSDPRGKLRSCGSLSKFIKPTFKMCFEILGLWIKSLNAFINQSELFKDILLPFMLLLI